MSPILLLIAAGAGLSAAAFVAGIARLVVIREPGVRGRLEALTERSPYEREVELFRDRRDSSIPFLNTFFGRRRSTAATRLRLERAGLPLRVGEFFTIRVIAALLGMLVGMALAPMAQFPAWLFGGLGVVIGGMLPAFFLRFRISRRQQAIEVQLVEFCDLMASMLESGFGYLQALTTTAEQIGEPLSSELGRILDSVRLGGDIDEALDELNDRLDSPDFDMMVTAISIQRRSGGNLAEILRGVAQTIRERHSFRRDIAALTSQQRYAAMFLVAFPFILGLALTLLLNETYGRLWTTSAGRIMLGAAVIMDGIGFFAIRRVLKLEV